VASGLMVRILVAPPGRLANFRALQRCLFLPVSGHNQRLASARAVTARGSHRCLAGSHASTSPANPARAATGSATICSMHHAGPVTTGARHHRVVITRDRGLLPRRKIHRQDRPARADQLTPRRELRIPPGYPSPDCSPAVGHNILLGPG
jgi:hypothetical protein